MTPEVLAAIIGAYILIRGRAMGLPDYLSEYIAAWAVLYFIHRMVFLGQ